LNTTFQNLAHAQFFADSPNTFGRIPISLDRCARDDLEASDLGKPGEQIVLNTACKKIRTILVWTGVGERQNGE